MELIAPARDLETLSAAFDAGADAVYVGLKQFSARKAAKNLSFEEFLTANEIKKRLNKKLYVALNTLIFQDEIPALIDILAFLETCSVDAIIIQDFGIYELIKTFSINIPLHGSTQMGTKEVKQAQFLEKLGFKRVVLERQLTIKEIEKIKENTNIELEVFVHGALCFSFSGMCFFSRAFTERSGNRGDCAQPCRWGFVDEDGKVCNPFSMKDLTGLSAINCLLKIGVASLKIEGRMKGVDYVYPVVSAYRKAIDLAKEGKLNSESIKEIEKGLNYSSLSRKGSTGFFFFDTKKTALTGDVGTGIFLGTVSNVTKTSVFFRTKELFSVGDTVRIDKPDGDERVKLPVKAIYFENEKVRSATSGSLIGIPSGGAKVKAGYKVYLVHRRESYKLGRIKQLALPTISFEKRACELKEAYYNYQKSLPTYDSKVLEQEWKPKKEYKPPLHFYATNVFSIKFLEKLGAKKLYIAPDLNEKTFPLIKPFFPLWIRLKNMPLCVSRTPVKQQVYRLKSMKNKKIDVKEINRLYYLFECS